MNSPGLAHLIFVASQETPPVPVAGSRRCKQWADQCGEGRAGAGKVQLWGCSYSHKSKNENHVGLGWILINARPAAHSNPYAYPPVPRAYNAVCLCQGLDWEWGFTVRASSFCVLDVLRIPGECTKHGARKWPVPLQYALAAPASKRRTHFASGRC
jgi:hypothetical protein